MVASFSYYFKLQVKDKTVHFREILHFDRGKLRKVYGDNIMKERYYHI